jgi:shikimate dehydrogenase
VSEHEKFLMAGVMGWPVLHSRSPLMHNYWMEQQGVWGTYVPLEIDPKDLEAALRGLRPLGFAGCNLTIPHKLEAMKIVDEVDDVATKIGAISCVVVREDGTLFATNNDWIGFLGNLRHTFPDWRGDAGPATVIGAGGGGRAVVYALLDAGAPEIRLVNRTPSKPVAIAEQFGGPIVPVAWEDRHEALKGAAMVVNATSQGMDGQPPLDLSLNNLSADTLCADIIYTPLESPFLAAARAKGNRTINGLGMLLHQGPPAWERWFGLKPEVTPELRKLLEDSFVG